METENVYSTSDLYEATFLYSSNRKLINLDIDLNKKVRFVFEDKRICQKLLEQYLLSNAQVNAKKFVDSLHSLRNTVFSIKKRI